MASFGDEVRYVLADAADARDELLGRLRERGESVEVVSDGERLRVHVHTDAIEPAVDAGREIGAVEDLEVDDLHEQVSAAEGADA